MKGIITISLDETLIERLPPSPMRSSFIEVAIRSALNRESRENMTTIKVKNLARVLEVIDENQWAQKQHIMKLTTLELGITDKTFNRYVELLAYNGRIIDLNGWVVSKSYAGPMPWTPEGAQMRAELQMKKLAKGKAALLSNEEDDIMSAERVE